MKSIIMVFSLFIASAFAGTQSYYLNMKLSVNGKYESSPQLVTMEGELASLNQKIGDRESFLEVITSDDQSGGILMQYTFGFIEKDGSKRIISKPQILALENELAEITLNDDNDNQLFALSVIAQRKPSN